MFERVAVSVLCLFAWSACAQTPRGSLHGTVQDASGARIASAKIVVQALASPLQRDTTTEDRGEFRIDDLPPGMYRVSVTASGFAPAQTDVAIVLSTVREALVTLRPASATTTVTVAGQASSITTQAAYVRSAP